MGSFPWLSFGNLAKGGVMEQLKVFLDESEIPKKWYNILADMPTPMSPPLHPANQWVPRIWPRFSL